MWGMLPKAKRGRYPGFSLLSSPIISHQCLELELCWKTIDGETWETQATGVNLLVLQSRAEKGEGGKWIDPGTGVTPDPSRHPAHPHSYLLGPHPPGPLCCLRPSRTPSSPHNSHPDCHQAASHLSPSGHPRQTSQD